MTQGMIRMWLTGGLIALVSLSAGCNIVAPASYIISGPPSVEAQHTLADVPTVIYIDDRSNQVNPVSLRRVIAETAGEDLMEKKLLTTTISPQDAMNIAARNDRNKQIMSIEEIGKAVGAKQVIYVEMLQFSDTPDGFTPRPLAACRVRVVDVENRQRVFPGPDVRDTSHPMQVMTREVDPELYRTRSGRLQVFQALALETGHEIGKLFYKHERKELGGSLNPR
jgi:hypothetical protein